ncbi:nucleotidyltransferase [Acetobacteraceae bacterium]|nr:nucleotidyltransferase [Acetobacteraceae bacterium]
MKASEKLKRHKAEIIQQLNQYGLQNPRVFGSVARGEDDDESDIDLLVDESTEIDPFKMCGLYAALEDITGVRVDIVRSNRLTQDKHASIFHDAKPI